MLGHLKQVLPRRPDLKVIVTSATIDADRFARHFASKDGEPAPVIQVSGRLFPVEQRWRPFEESREAFSDIATDRSSALKIEISRYIRARSTEITTDADLVAVLNIA